jgi:hypothetical protein
MMAEKKSVKIDKTAPAAKPKAAAAAKPMAASGTASKRTEPKKPTAKKTAPLLSVDQLEKEIRAQALKVYENRQAKGLAGDELSDWLEAEVVIKKKFKL